MYISDLKFCDERSRVLSALWCCSSVMDSSKHQRTYIYLSGFSRMSKGIWLLKDFLLARVMQEKEKE